MTNLTRLIATFICIAALHALPVAAAEQAVVTNRTVYPGQEIDHSMLRVVKLRPGSVAPYAFVSTIDEIVGKVASRTILPKRYIPAGSVREPSLVQVGQTVRTIYQTGGLRIVSALVALSPGAAGDVIRLRNPSSGKFIAGTVQKDGSVVASVH